MDCVGVTDDVSDHNPGYSGNVDACPASLSSHWSRSTKPDSLCDHDAGKERESTETVKRRSRLKVQDLETEEFPEEEPADFQEEPVETEKIQLIENPLPLPKKHVPKVLDYKLDNDDDSDFDYPVADDDDFDH